MKLLNDSLTLPAKNVIFDFFIRNVYINARFMDMIVYDFKLCILNKISFK